MEGPEGPSPAPLPSPLLPPPPPPSAPLLSSLPAGARALTWRLAAAGSLAPSEPSPPPSEPPSLDPPPLPSLVRRSSPLLPPLPPRGW